MAKFTPIKSPPPANISRFLGVNEAIGESQLKVGEALVVRNFRITQDYKLTKRQGYQKFVDTNAAIQSIWNGRIGEKDVIIFCTNGKVYEYEGETETILLDELIAEEVVTEIGTITDVPTQIFYFNSKVYFINGTDYKEYNGTTYQDVEPYIPLIATGTPPTGGGDDFEEINLLTGTKKQQFLGNGTATAFTVREVNLDIATTKAWVDGTEKTEDTDYTVNRTTGIITFTTAPPNLAEVIIQWTKEVAGNKELVTKNKYAMLYGVSNDTSIFLWGNPDQINRRSWSETLNAGYYPVFNFTLVGSNEYPITDIISVYDRQLIFKEDRTHYSFPEFVELLDKYDYPVRELNATVGNEAFGQVQLINNMPMSLHKQSIYSWVGTDVKDERNAQIISERIRESLEQEDLTKAITYDLQREREYWINIDDTVYVYNYGTDTFYMYTNIKATCFRDINNTLYFGTETGIMVKQGVDDLEEPVESEIIFGFVDWGVFELRKNTRELYFSLLPAAQTSVKILFRTNRINEFKEVSKLVEYRLFDLENINFNAFSFKTNRNPQSFRRRFRAKKYTYIQFKFENKELGETATILAFKVQSESQGLER